MSIKPSFWSQAQRVFAQFLEHDGAAQLRVGQIVDLILGVARGAQHQATSELFTMLGHLPNAADLGAKLGKRIPMTAFGEMSLGIRVAPKLRDALRLAADFHHQAIPLLDYSYVETPTEGRFIVGFRSPIDSKGEALLMMAIACMADAECARWSGRSGNIKKLELTPSSKPYESAYRRHLSLVPDTEHGINTIVFSRSVIELSNPTADPDTFRDLVAACVARDELKAIEVPTSVRVREQVMSSIGNPPTVTNLAKSLHMTPRQLRLALARDDTNYQTIVRSCRIEYASALFRNPRLSLSQIAERLGYSDLSAFTHAFCRWTGKSPSTFRIEVLSQSAPL